MKTLKLLGVLFFTLIIASCSSDSDSDGISNTDLFSYKFENQDVNVTNWIAIRTGDFIEVVGNDGKGDSFGIRFNVHGDLSSATAVANEGDADGFPNAYWAYEYFKSNYFSFELLGLDEANKRVSVRFSGPLYEDSYDLDSEVRNVEGSFNVAYIEADPQVEGLEFFAKIDGNDWYSSDGDLSAQGNGFDWILSVGHINDDAYKISYVIDPNELDTGTFGFNINSTINKISFAKFDPNTQEFIEYKTIGEFTIAEHEQGFGFKYIKGTFSLTAVNGDETITITDGRVSDIYTF